MDYYSTLLKLPLSFLMASTLAGCGGGGGGGSTDTENTIRYTGNTSGATLSTANTADFIEGAFTTDAGGPASVLGVEASTQPHSANLIKLLNDTVHTFTGIEIGDTVIGVQIDETEVCTEGGTTTITGTANDTNGDFSGNVTLSDCMEDGTLLNGQMTISTSFDLNTAEFNAPLMASFDNLTATDASNNSSTLVGDLICRFDEAPQPGPGQVFISVSDAFWCNQNLLIKNSSDQKVYKLENYEVIALGTVDTSLFAVQQLVFKGRYYHPDHGYVDVSDGPNDFQNSSTRAVFLFLLPINTPFLGSGMLTGANNSAVEILAIPDNVTSEPSSTYYELFLDADGDGTFDAPVLTLW